MCQEKLIEEATRKLRHFLAIISYREPLGQIFEVDLRLRPYGKDGPLLVTLSALSVYYSETARHWEKQMLTRARIVAGNVELSKAFQLFKDELLYTSPADFEESQQIWKMRRKIEKEKVSANSNGKSFKASPGGLIDIDE